MAGDAAGRRAGRRRGAALAAAVALSAVSAAEGPDHVRAAAFVARAADAQGWLGGFARRHAQAFREEDVVIPSRQGALPGRLYRPAKLRRTVVVLPGVHAMGMDEPRMVAFARDLAEAGVAVVTPELPDLKEYRLTAASVDAVEDVARWAVGRPDLAGHEPPALAGISFAGGLAVVAAGRPAVRDRLSYAASMGGHGDLPRVLRYLCTGVQPDGTRRPPHDYGLAVILLNRAERLVPPEQAEPLRAGIRLFLHASHLDVADHLLAREAFERARKAEAGLPEPAASLLRMVNDRDTARLGPVLLPHVEGWATEPALSPERSPAPAAPVYLLHGSDDDVIPAQESLLLARRLEPGTPVTLLVSPLLTHAELGDERGLLDLGRLVAFWAEVLA